MCAVFVFLSACLISFTPPCDGGNILVFPVDGSHWINMKILLEELHARGHSITVMRASTSWYIPEKSPLYTSITMEMDEGLENFFDVYLQEHMRVCHYALCIGPHVGHLIIPVLRYWSLFSLFHHFSNHFFQAQREGASALTFFKLTMGFLSMITQAHSLWADALAEVFDDAKVLQSLKDSQYDVVLTDPAIAPGVVLAKYLKLPIVLNVRWITSGEGHFTIAPSPLSYIPVPGSGLTDKMTFIQRVKNMLFYSIILFQQKFMVGPSYDAICEKYIEGGCDIISLLQEADIWLFRSDFVFDFPRPTMPNVVYIGGFQCKPAQPLPADLEEFVQSAGEHGVIIMTLGTLVNALPKEVADEIASVFAKMPQKVTHTQ